MKVSLYARESSADTTKAPPIQDQIERGKTWARENGHDVVTIYADNGYSGGNWKRPDWNQSVKDAKRHMYEILWVWDQDRLARDTEQFLWFYRNINTAKVKIYEHTSKSFIDMDSLGNRVKHQSLAQAAEIFRLVTSEKVKRAYEEKKKKNGAWGRRKKQINIEVVRDLRDKGYGYREIAKQIGNVSYQTIRRALQNTHKENQEKS